jgi:hypothetical protein
MGWRVLSKGRSRWKLKHKKLFLRQSEYNAAECWNKYDYHMEKIQCRFQKKGIFNAERRSYVKETLYRRDDFACTV